MIKDDRVYLEHILEAIEKIQIFFQGFNKFEFDRNVMVQDAVIRNIEIIGEATKKITKQFTKSHSEIPWQDMAGITYIKICNFTSVKSDLINRK